MSSTAEQMRNWAGPALLTYGFRPFFLGAALWAAVAMGLWALMLGGQVPGHSAFDPVSWHAHAFLFGYLSAVIAGFLLTAVPNWTGRLPIVGWPLAALFGLWIAGRIAVTLSQGWPPLAIALIDLAMPVMLAAVIAREVVIGRNWRNLIILALLLGFLLGNALFHWEAAQGAYAAQGYGLRIGLAASLMMIAVVGGRVTPSFTRNWLVKQGAKKLPTPPMQRFDKLVLLVLLLGLSLWVALPTAGITAAVIGAAGALHLLRLARWEGVATRAEPLVLILHLAYLFVPLGALALAIEIAAPGLTGLGAVQHLWMSGALGLMTLAVMTRATLGHTGQPLTAGWGTCGIYGAIILATLLRVAAGIWPAEAPMLYTASAIFWIGGFAGFVALYGALLLRAGARAQVAARPKARR